MTKTYLFALTLHDEEDAKIRNAIKGIVEGKPFKGKSVKEMQTMWRIESDEFKTAKGLCDRFELELEFLKLFFSTNFTDFSIDLFAVDITGRTPVEVRLDL